MANNDDPFFRPDATKMRPRPGSGRRGDAPRTQVTTTARRAGPRLRAPSRFPPPARALIGVGLNPLVRAATPLLLLTAQMRESMASVDVGGLRRHGARRDPSVRGAGARRRRAERGRARRALRAVRRARRSGAVDAVGRIRASGRSIRCWSRCTAKRGAARSSSRCSIARRRIRRSYIDLMELQYSGARRSASPASIRCRSAGRSKLLEIAAATLPPHPRASRRRADRAVAAVARTRGSPQSDLHSLPAVVGGRRPRRCRFWPIAFTAYLRRPGRRTRRRCRRSWRRSASRISPRRRRRRRCAGRRSSSCSRADEQSGALSVEEQGGRTHRDAAGARPVRLGQRDDQRCLHRRRCSTSRRRSNEGARPRAGRRPHRQPADQVAPLPGQLRAVARARRQRRVAAEAGQRQPGAIHLDRRRIVGAAIPRNRIRPTGRAIAAWRSSTCAGREDAVFSFLKRSFVRLIAFLLIALFIWCAGPYFAFGTYRPLESDVSRYDRDWPDRRAVAAARDRQVAARLAATDKLVGAIARSRPEKERPSRRGREAARAVRRGGCRAEGARGGTQPLRSAVVRVHRRAGIGQDDGAGQFGAAVSARAARRQGRGARRRRDAQLRLVVHGGGGVPRHRRPLHDAGLGCESRIAEGWREFLSLLRTYRVRRPLNGVILTISCAGSADAERARARGLRRGGASATAGAGRRAPRPAAGVRDGDQVRPGPRLYRLLRRSRSRRAARRSGASRSRMTDALSGAAPGAVAGEFDALMRRLNERVLRTRRAGARRPAAGVGVCVSAADVGAARSDRDVRRRRVHRVARRSPDSAARRLLHQRHAGRHADRSAARQHRPAVRRRRPTRWPRRRQARARRISSSVC